MTLRLERGRPSMEDVESRSKDVRRSSLPPPPSSLPMVVLYVSLYLLFILSKRAA